MKTTGYRPSGRRVVAKSAALAGVIVAALTMSACSGGGGAAGGSDQTDSGGAINIWVDPPRVPAAEAFIAANPDIKVNMTQIDGTVGGKTLQQQFAQFNSAGKGWPDALFFPSNDDIAWASGAQIDYTADLGKLLPDVVKGYDKAVIDPCVRDGKTVCLRNDAAPDVFWYNASFFAENGYTPPTTWEEYADLAVKITAEHPDKISGFMGDAYAPDRYLWASGCPTNDRLSETEVHINLDDEKCVRAKDLLTKLVDGKAVSTLGIFDADAASVGPNLVMSPGAVWWGDYLFNQTWKIPAGTMTAVTPLTWDGESTPATGNEGGGLWGVSNHIKGKQLENTLKFAEFVATDPAWQVDLTTGLPGYGPVQDDWIAKQSASNYFADNETTFAAAKKATTYVQPDHAYMLYNTGGIWTETVTPALVGGSSFDEAWKTFGEELNNQAKSFGYTVVDSK